MSVHAAERLFRFCRWAFCHVEMTARTRSLASVSTALAADWQRLGSGGVVRC